jgi:spore germination cell wall hydrolase CwlJ-like protein
MGLQSDKLFDLEREPKRFNWAWIFAVLALAFFVNSEQTDKKNVDLQAQLLKVETEDRATIAALTESLKQYEDRIDAQRAEVLKKEAEEAKKKADRQAKINFIQNEVKCLADNIYNEAAFEPDDGKLAVATVTMNRVYNRDYPKTVCGVVYERHVAKASNKIVCMFSWTCKPRHAAAVSLYHRIMDMAKAVYYKHERSDEVADALLYHAVYIKAPNWATPENLVATIGQHAFYREP